MVQVLDSKLWFNRSYPSRRRESDWSHLEPAFGVSAVRTIQGNHTCVTALRTQARPAEVRYSLSRIAIYNNVITECKSYETCICWLGSALPTDSGILQAMRGSQRRTSAARADRKCLSIVWRSSPMSSREVRTPSSEQNYRRHISQRSLNWVRIRHVPKQFRTLSEHLCKIHSSCH